MFKEESGAYWLNTAQVIDIGPGNKAQPLHRDLENNYPFVTMGPSGPEAANNFLIALTDFTEENGATRVIPGSHLWPDFTNKGTPEMTIPAEIKLEMPSSSAESLFMEGASIRPTPGELESLSLFSLVSLPLKKHLRFW